MSRPIVSGRAAMTALPTKAQAETWLANLADLDPASEEFLGLAAWLYTSDTDFHASVFFALQYQLDLWDIRGLPDRVERIKILAHHALLQRWIIESFEG